MLITATSLYRETKNFFCHKIFTIFILSILTSCLTISINYFFIPEKYHALIFNKKNNILLEKIKNIPLEEQNKLFYISGVETLSSLIGNVFLIANMLTLIATIASRKKIFLFHIICTSIKIFPKLFFLTLIVNLIIQIGFMVLLIPGIVMMILLAPAPIILIMKKSNIHISIQDSLYFSWNNIKLISPAVIVWLLVKIVLLFTIISLSSFISINILSIIFHFISNLMSAILIIYLFRFYMLMHKK